jgi:hypothetical protein
MLVLAQRLRQASSGHDWDELAKVDGDVAILLPAFAARGPFDRAETQAVQVLREAHRAAIDCCAREAQQIDERMALMRANREGWMAYAMSGDEEGV